eukprot:TRINITY_DN18299_c0_g1_i1.p1 TRINITY_DN18299_c0_g1~~TRINITY_DN18299_c0_g1_i1.p1  ORF type:complete len:130 (-),score=6.56 TRINITY_DN18299_c0_g1_i1:131-520(-)
MICVSLGCEHHPIYSLKFVQETHNNNTLRILVHLKLLVRVRIKLGFSLRHSCYCELESCYSETTFCRLTNFGTFGLTALNFCFFILVAKFYVYIVDVMESNLQLSDASVQKLLLKANTDENEDLKDGKC